MKISSFRIVSLFFFSGITIFASHEQITWLSAGILTLLDVLKSNLSLTWEPEAKMFGKGHSVF